MLPRRTLLERFTTFVQFAHDHFSHWAIDARLKRSMTQVLAAYPLAETPPDSGETFWVIYWQQQWRSQQAAISPVKSNEAKATSPTVQQFPLHHLAAYLQETCYWVAHHSNTALLSQQFHLADYFQMAIVVLPKVIQGYTPEYGANLKTYANLCFSHAIRDALRHQREADSRSDWGLLRKLSQKRFIDGLQQAGLSGDTIAAYVLAWNCFKLHSAPTTIAATRSLTTPDRTTWQAITDRYNQQRPASASAATPTQLEQWLTQCAKYARHYLHPPTTSLNLLQADRTDELQDSIAADTEASPLTALLIQEELQARHRQQTQIYQVLTGEIAQLDASMQDLLRRYYVQQQTQQEIAKQLDLKQYTVSRRLSRIKEQLLLAIAHWSQESLHITPTSTAVKAMSVLLEEWLEAQYQPANHAPKEAS